MIKKILVYLLIISIITMSGLPALGESTYTIEATVSKTNYKIDEYITGSGIIYVDGTPQSNTPVTMVVENKDGKSIYDVEQYTTDNEGKFSIRFRMIKSAKEGAYYIKLKSSEAEKTIQFNIVKETSKPSDDGSKKKTPKWPLEEKKETSQGIATITTDDEGNKIVSFNVDNNKLANEIQKSSNGSVVINAAMESNANEVLVNINSRLFNTASENNTKLEISTGSATISIEPETLSLEDGAEISFTTKTLNREDAEEILAQLGSEEFNPAALVFDFDITSSKGEVIFNKPLTITIEYDPSKVIEPEKLGVYYFNEAIKEWQYTGGRVTKEGTIEFIVEHFSKYTAMEYRKTFDDISTVDWAQKQIEVLAARHVINGIDNKNFAPNSNITRAAFAKLLVEGLELKAGNQSVSFTDVKSGDWYKDTVEIAASLGIVVGYDGKFDPNGEISRQEMAVMIVRALKHINPDGAYKADVSVFADYDQMAEWAKEAVEIASSKGLVNGTGNDKFSPQGKATRAQSAVIIYRLLNLLDRI